MTKRTVNKKVTHIYVAPNGAGKLARHPEVKGDLPPAGDWWPFDRHTRRALNIKDVVEADEPKPAAKSTGKAKS